MQHAYGNSDAFTLGVEEEFQIVEKDSGKLTCGIELILSELSENEKKLIKPELFQSVVETATPVCNTPEEVLLSLSECRQRIIQILAPHNLTLSSSGTHPFSLYKDQLVTERERYKQIMKSLHWVAQRGVIFGLHVHVGLQACDEAAFVASCLRNHIPQFIALSANSPYWQGEDTGMDSCRVNIFESFPRSGIPPLFGNWREYETYITDGQRMGIIPDSTYVWWDVRLHPAYGTVEVRAFDAQTKVSDSVNLATLVQALARHYSEMFYAKEALQVCSDIILQTNRWRASRFGPQADCVTKDGDICSMQEAITNMLETAKRFLDQDALLHLQQMAACNGASRQRACQNPYLAQKENQFLTQVL